MFLLECENEASKEVTVIRLSLSLFILLIPANYTLSIKFDKNWSQIYSQINFHFLKAYCILLKLTVLYQISQENKLVN